MPKKNVSKNNQAELKNENAKNNKFLYITRKIL